MPKYFDKSCLAVLHSDVIPKMSNILILKTFSVTGVITISILQFGMLFFAFLHKSFQPFRARQLNSLIIYSIGSTFALIGTSVRIGSFGPEGIWSECQIWILWAQSFGASIASAAMIYRYTLLYCHGIVAHPTKLQFWGPVVIPCIMMILICLVPLFIPHSITSRPVLQEDHIKRCVFGSNMPYMLYSALFFQLVILLYFNWRTSLLPKVFIQYRELRNGLVFVVSNVVIQLFLLALYKEIYFLTWVMNAISLTSPLFAILVPPTYWYIADPEGYQNSMAKSEGKSSFKTSISESRMLELSQRDMALVNLRLGSSAVIKSEVIGP